LEKDLSGIINGVGLGTYLFVKVPRPGDSEETFSVFESSCHMLLPHSKVQAIPLSALQRDYELAAYLYTIPFYAER